MKKAKYVNSNRVKPLTLLEGYGNTVGFDIHKDPIFENEAKTLFEVIISDYLTRRVSVDDLCSFCELIYTKLSPSSRTFSILRAGTEISWDLRHDPFSAAGKIDELVKTFERKHSE